MPPKPARRNLPASYELEIQAIKTRWERILQFEKPELQIAEYQALCPVAPVGDARWTSEDEQALQLGWQSDPKATHLRTYDYVRNAVDFRTLWIIFPRVYRCLPTDLISPKYGLGYDANTTERLANNVLNPVWAPKFAAALKTFSLHAFWHYSPEDDFPLMAIVLTYAIMSRTNDCRAWPHTTNPTDSTFLDRFLAVRNSPDMANCTLREVHDKVAAELQLEGKRPSDVSLLFRGIDQYFQRHSSATNNKTDEPAPLVKLLQFKDVDAAVAGLEAINPKGSLSAKHWALMCTKTRESPTEPPKTSPVLASVFGPAYLDGIRQERMLARPLPSTPIPAPPSDVGSPPSVAQE